jgi:hypothetical protein
VVEAPPPPPPQAEIIVEAPPAPPPPIVEAPPPPPPSTEFVWAAGYHRWDGHRYVWAPGHYERRPRVGARWVPARWEVRGRGKVWVEAHFE